MEPFNRCLICQEEISNLSFSNLKLCQKFLTVASRYYNIDFADSSINLWKTLKLNQLFDGDFAQILVSCDNCSQKINTFCEIYEEVSFFQINLDASARKITELMKHSNKSNNATPNFGMFECFRNQFYSKVAKHFPRVKLRRLEEKDNVSTIDNDPLYISEENEDSGNEAEFDNHQMDHNHRSEDSCSTVPLPPTTQFKTELSHQANNVDKVIKISKVVSTAEFNSGVENTVEILKSLPQGSLLVVPSTAEAERPHKCRFCDKTFKTRLHQNSHENVHLQPHQCRFCNRRFSFRGTRTAHERTHTGIKPFKCSVCGGTFRERRRCKSHIWTVHKGNGEVIKDLNIAQFSNLAEPKSVPALAQPGANPNSEDSENPFKCAICLKTFAQRRSLIRHHPVHTKPFHCDICDARFSNKSALEAHQRTHTGERPYLCPICFRTFTQRHSCKVHQRDVHKIANGIVINTKASGVEVVSANVLPLPQANQNVTPENQSVREIQGIENLQSTFGEDGIFILPDTKQEPRINLNENVIETVDTPLEDPFGDV